MFVSVVLLALLHQCTITCMQHTHNNHVGESESLKQKYEKWQQDSQAGRQFMARHLIGRTNWASKRAHGQWKLQVRTPAVAIPQLSIHFCKHY